MFGWFKKQPSAARPPVEGSPPCAVLLPWYGGAVTLAGRPNTTERRPEDLESLAQDGEGIYRNTVAVWGESLVDVTRRLSVETQAGGVVFFDRRNHSHERFEALARLLEVNDGDSYRVYSKKSADPLGDGYWTQWRFVSDFAWRFYFGREQAGTDGCPAAPERLVERMIRTLEEEKTALDEVNFDEFISRRYKQTYEGSIRYGFGFLVENSYYGVYRLWSRILFYSK